MGQVLLEEGRVDEGMALLTRVAHDDPQRPTTHVGLGTGFAMRNRNEEALRAFRTALDLSPHFSEAELQIGILALRGGDPSAAESWFRSVLERVPTHVEARGYLALTLHASLLVAVGLLMSSITESQVVAAALSIGAFLMLWFADSVSYLLPPPFDSFAINLSLIGHFKPMVSGSVFLSDIGYFVTASMLALFLTTWGLAQR